MTTTPFAAPTKVTLRLLEKTDREIVKLDRAIVGAVYKFQHDFRANPRHPGLRLKQLEGHDRLYSARVNADYRALLLHLSESEWLLVAVKHRGHVYENLDRLSYGINQVTGSIDYVDLEIVESGVLRKGRPPAAPAASSTAPAEPEPVRERPLFANVTSQQLADLGVAEPLIPVVARLTTDEELLGLVEYAPRHTGEVLLRLRDVPYQQVLEEVTRPVEVKDVDPEDYRAAVERTDTTVITTDKDLESIIEERDFGRWKVFLHPTQKRLVTRRYSGPARVGGGPGTGKTIVALHRVKHLVDRLGPGNGKPVLFTTFNKNLAADLRARLLALGGPETLARVEIAHVDQLATRVVREADPGSTKSRIDDTRALNEWRQILLETGETKWDAEFLMDEWTQVILGQAVNSRAGYFKARRAGRGRSITRADRAEIWQLSERFTQRLDEKNLETHRQVAERAARLEIERTARIEAAARAQEERGGLGNVHAGSATGAWQRHRYRHIVVDEAQDLAAAHWKMLRAMVAPGPDDIFLVGDTHQRIYDNRVTLGSLGVHIRGRSAKLTLSYRTTHEILKSALRVLGDEHFDDLDGDEETLAGYRSVLYGSEPVVRCTDSFDDELDAITEQIKAWHDIRREDIAVCVPTNDMVTQVGSRLARSGIVSTEITADGPRGDEGVHVGTMYRFKGLEYRRMIIAGVQRGLVPRASVEALRRTDPARYQAECKRARSLLFVAATRARDALTLVWHGEPSPLLGSLALAAGRR
ncbi:UvrD-like helicase family protein [Streptomyces sp. BK208]|uniref:UvrD-helicase domain-containing protein n=1 Tax=Streptomyces sp. BK208 TaxID=2512150 RepID=UPI00105BF434|nr:UvrD-helicase domain-containing protein [Streptomyces sp. BK208]TDT40029.1 UvrD-like helicase family protein [Streptomyces sp. BK208]